MNWLETMLANRVLARLEVKMGQNWKGKVGGIGAMLAGVAGLLTEFSTGTLSVEKIMVYVAAISGGLSLFGIRQAIGKADTPTP